MRVYNPKTEMLLRPELKTFLADYRRQRGFDAETCVAAKTRLLNDYLRDSGLASCVIGVSGGIDSAVTLALIVAAAEAEDTPISKIVPVCLPVHAPGATHQDQATARAQRLIRQLGLEANVIDLTDAHAALRQACVSGSGLAAGDWADGQLVSYARTPALYFLTSLLTEAEEPGLVCGTINRDEGAYLGYVGKAGDGMVDIQLIADLHKSEVYALAEYLKLPAEVIEAVPNGDMYDGREDVEVFGAPYDFVELYLHWLCLADTEQKRIRTEWGAQANEQFERMATNLEHLHTHNKHKYSVGSPAVHLDFYRSGVPGGWPDDR